MKLVRVILLFCLAQTALGSYINDHRTTSAKRSPVLDEQMLALKRPPICRTKPRLCEKIRFKICPKACVEPKKPSCCAYRINTRGDAVTLGGRGLCFTQGYIKRNFALTLADPNASGKEQAARKAYLFMCPEGTDLLTTSSRRASPSIERNWPKMVNRIHGGEVGYFGVRTSSWVRRPSTRSPGVAQLVAYTNALLALADKQEANKASVEPGEAAYAEDKFVDYILSAV